MSENARGIHVVDSLAYVAAADFHVFDVSMPANPQQIGYYHTQAWAQGVYKLGSYAYVTDGDLGLNTGLRVIDVSDSTNPQEIGYYDTPGNAKDVYVSGSYAYVADGTDGLRVIDISVPTNPQEIGYYYTPALAQGIYVLSSYAYVASEYCGLQIYEFLLHDVEESADVFVNSGLRLLQNPVRDNYIELWLPVPHTGTSVLSLYNALGQRVKLLSLNNFSSGEHFIRMPTKDLSGGVYFLKLEAGAGNYKDTKKVILLR